MNSRENITIAILVPTYDELGNTIDKSIYNLALRIKEIAACWPGAAIAFLIGVNGTDNLEDVARVETLVNSHEPYFRDVHVAVHHYTQPGKENAMNQLADEAKKHFSRQELPLNFIIGTDVKVYRTPHSLVQLIEEFLHERENSELPRYLGGSVVPYPIEIYKEHYSLTPEQELFYTLLEIDKDPEVLAIIPKSHVRGGLYITGNWVKLYTDIPDDYQLRRRAEQEYGAGSTRISTDAIGYYIPRQSFADYFAVRLKRSIPAEERLRQTHPELNPAKETPLESEDKKRQLELLLQSYPTKFRLFLTKKKLDLICRDIALNMNSAYIKLNTLQSEVIKWLQKNSPSSISVLESKSGVSLEIVQKIAKLDPEMAAKYIVVYYRSIIEALAVDINSVEYGPREKRFRGMLDLDEPTCSGQIS